jgi:hypothetical protein
MPPKQLHVKRELLKGTINTINRKKVQITLQFICSVGELTIHVRIKKTRKNLLSLVGQIFATFFGVSLRKVIAFFYSVINFLYKA